MISSIASVAAQCASIEAKKNTDFLREYASYKADFPVRPDAPEDVVGEFRVFAKLTGGRLWDRIAVWEESTPEYEYPYDLIEDNKLSLQGVIIMRTMRNGKKRNN